MSAADPHADFDEAARAPAPLDPAILASVVLVMQDGYAAIARTVAALSTQTVADRTELVVVAPGDAEDLPADPRRDALARTRLVRQADASLGEAQAHGVRAASGAVVILGEDHAWPEPEYVEALAAACDEHHAAVGPAMVNANPWSVVSWGNLLIAYGRWTEPVEPGVIDVLPGTNTAYFRSVLLGYGEELDTLMAREGGLLQRMRRDGHELYLEPRARVAHQNVSGLGAGASLRYHAGRLYAAKRSEQERWGPGKRALYAAAAPLIPLLRFKRIVGELRGRGMPLSPRRIAGVAMGVTFDGVGQMAGFGVGAGGSAEKLQDFEYNRYRYLSRRDRQEAGLTAPPSANPGGAGQR